MNSSCPPSTWTSAGNAIALWVWHSEERVCFFLMLGVRNPSLFPFISFWDAFFLNLFWAFTFFLSSSPLKWTLKQDTSYISICKKLNQSSWPLLVRLIYFFFFFFPFLSYCLLFIFYHLTLPGLMRRKKKQNTYMGSSKCHHKLVWLQSWQYQLEAPDSWQVTSVCWERMTSPKNPVLQSFTSCVISKGFHSIMITRWR